MKQSIITLLFSLLCTLTHVKAQSSCNVLFNYGINDALNPYSVQTFPNIIQGYLFGHNAYGDIGKAEFFDNPYSNATIHTVRLKFAVARTNNPNATININVWDNTGFDGDGNPGAPGNVLKTQTVPINTIPTGGNDLVINFSPPITVSTDFFVGITYSYAAGDTVALYANDDGLTVPGTSWEQWGPLSFPVVWYPLRDASNTWGINNSLFISVELCYLCPTITLNVTSTNNTSCTNPNGTITVTASGGNAPYTFNNGITINNNGLFTGLTGGTYQITVTDANGCSATVSQTITNIDGPVVTVSNIQNNTACVPPYNGSLIVTISGGTPPYSFQFSDGSSGIIPGSISIPITGLAADTYSATVTDANGCSVIASAVVENNLPTITLNEINNQSNTSCSNPNGSFEVVASGGAGGFVYSISGQSNTTGVFTGLAGGTYTVTATGTDGCSGTLAVTISDNLPQVTVTLVSLSDNTSCSNPNGSFEVVASGGAGGFVYSISGQSNTTGVFTGLAGGTYTVTATGTDGCSGTLAVTISDNLPQVTVTLVSLSDNTSCSNPNGSFEVVASGGAGGFVYSISGQSNTTGVFTGLAGGTYTVTATGTDGCSGTLAVTISNNLPQVTVTLVSLSDNTSCSNPNGSFEVVASGGAGGFVYSISGQSNTTGVFTGLAGGTYTVTATGTDGCSGTLAVTVASNTPVITVTISNIVDNTSCGTPNGAFTIEASGGTAPYSIDAGGSLIPLTPNPLTFSPVPAGNYSGWVVDSNGCTGAFSFTIQDLSPTVDLTVVSVTPNSLCVGANGALQVAAVSGTAPFIYTLLGPNPTSNQTGFFGGLTSDTYTVNVTDSNNCTGTIDVVVGNNTVSLTLTELNNQPNTVCVNYNGAFTVVATGGSGNYTYSDGIGFNNNGVFSNLPAGTYQVTATDDNTGCNGTIQITITDNIPDMIITELSNNPNSSCTSPNGAFTIEASGSVSPYLYDNGLSTNTDGVFTGLPAGTYSVTVTAANGCSESMVVTVDNNTPVIDVLITNNTPNTSCSIPNGSFTLSASGGTAPYTYSGAGVTNNNGIFTGLTGGNYSVTVTDDVGCSNVISVTIINNQDTLSLTTSSTMASSATAADGSASVTVSGGTAPYSYNWNNGGTTQTINNIPSGTYTVEVTDVNGCSATASVFVDFVVAISDIFSDMDIQLYPNPTNGVFTLHIDILDKKPVTITVINTTGETIFSEDIGSISKTSRRFDWNDYADGLYIMRITCGNYSAVKKILLNK